MISEDTYEEVYEVLYYMDKLTVMKIPRDILNEIIEKRNSKFKTRINKDDIFNQDNISKEALDVLCWLDFNYWMDSNKKEEIRKINYKKISLEEENKKKLYTYGDIFKKDDRSINDIKTPKSLINPKEHWYDKIYLFFVKIKNLLKNNKND